MAICAKYIQSGEPIGYAGGVPVTSSNVVMVATGTPPCAAGSFQISEGSPWELDLASGSQIGGAILLVMGVAFVMRMVRKSVESQYIERDE